MNWIKENWFKAGLLIVLLLLVGGAFYWYEWRPAKIREECANGQKGLVPEIYLNCVRQQGLSG